MFCLETICVRQRQLLNLPAHNERFNRTRLALWGLAQPLALQEVIALPDWLHPDQTYKCRVTYGREIETIEFEEYHVRPVHSLQLLNADGLDYTFKYADRQQLNALFAQRGTAHDVLLVQNGLLTDTTYANVALFDGQSWHTPARPLLAGTQRARLIETGVLIPADIRLEDLPQFQYIKLLNAMLDWEQTPVIPIRAIRPLV
jgi:4-amino-4-deoxychorismate lyase